MAYLLEPLQSLGGELVLLAVCLQVGNQLGEDRLELLEGGGHVGGSAGQVRAGNRYALAVRGDAGYLVWVDGSCERSGEPREALEACKQRNNGGQIDGLCVSYDRLAAPKKHSLSNHAPSGSEREACGTARSGRPSADHESSISQTREGGHKLRHADGT